MVSPKIKPEISTDIEFVLPYIDSVQVVVNAFCYNTTVDCIVTLLLYCTDDDNKIAFKYNIYQEFSSYFLFSVVYGLSPFAHLLHFCTELIRVISLCSPSLNNAV